MRVRHWTHIYEANNPTEDRQVGACMTTQSLRDDSEDELILLLIWHH